MPAVKSKPNITLYNFSTSIAGQPKAMPKDKYFLFFGRLSYEKGVKTLLEAFNGLPECHLKIVGTGPKEDELKAFVESNGMNNVEFLGYKRGKELQDLVANAYYVAGDVANANRVLNEVENPKNEDEEEFLDLKVGILFREEKKDEALKLAEELYEKFPKAFHLMSLCNVVSKSRREELLNAHENFRSGENVDADYVNMLITLQEFDRLENYLGKRQKQIHQLDAEIREGLAERLISVNQKALAKKFRSI